MRRIHPYLLVFPLLCLTGCPPPPPTPKGAYFGETEPMAAVIAAVNENNAAIPTLWAETYYEAWVVDERKRTTYVNGPGTLLYRRPQGMRLVGRKEFVGTIFEVGSTNDRYWLKLVPEISTMWWGRYEHLGKPCAGEIPIRPDLVLEVLGVATINTDFNALPVPTMRFNNEGRAYVFVWNAKLPDRWVAQREIWYDVDTKRPKRVLLYDVNGRVVLRAELSDHRPVEVPRRPRDRWPHVATRYHLRFPDSGTQMRIELSDVVLDKNGFPARRGIAFPNPESAGVDRVIQIDEGCED